MVWAAVGAAALTVGVGAYQATKANKTTNNAVNSQTQLANRQADLAEKQYGDTSALGQSGRMQLQQFLDFGMLPEGVQTGQAPDFGLDEFLRTGTLPASLQPGGLPGVPHLDQLGNYALPAVPQLDTLGTHALPKVADTTALNRDVLEQQFGRAREATVGNAPTQGGALARDMTGLESSRALGVTGLYSRQNELQYAQDLAEAQQKNALQVETGRLGFTQAEAEAERRNQLAQQTGLLGFQQATQEAQRQNQLKTSLFGVGTDLAQQRAIREADLRKSLLSAALGLPANSASIALGGLAGASSTYGNTASTGLKQAAMGYDLAGTGVGYGAPALALALRQANSTQPATKTAYDYGLE